MNKARAKQITDLIDKLEGLKTELETIKDEEQEYIDNVPESFQSGERYERAESAVSNMEDALTDFESMMDTLTSIE